MISYAPIRLPGSSIDTRPTAGHSGRQKPSCRWETGWIIANRAARIGTDRMSPVYALFRRDARRSSSAFNRSSWAFMYLAVVVMLLCRAACLHARANLSGPRMFYNFWSVVGFAGQLERLPRRSGDEADAPSALSRRFPATGAFRAAHWMTIFIRAVPPLH